MASYLPEVQYASERALAHRHAVLNPTQARAAALLHEERLARAQPRPSTVTRWVLWVWRRGVQPVTLSSVRTTRSLDGIA